MTEKENFKILFCTIFMESIIYAYPQPTKTAEDGLRLQKFFESENKNKTNLQHLSMLLLYLQEEKVKLKSKGLRVLYSDIKWLTITKEGVG